MAKFLDTSKAVSELVELIKNAGENLILISPYLKVSPRFKELLNYRRSKDKVTTVIFGKQELNPDEMRFFQELGFISLLYNENLHAKCYVNDEKMIITSLNFYDFSMSNNKEMGILIEKSDMNDLQIFEDAMKEVDFIRRTSVKFELGSTVHQMAKSVPLSKPSEKASSFPSSKSTGFCIRTGKPIPFNPEKPLSDDAFASWAKFKNPAFAEKFCHFSGEPSNGETSFEKPILRKNWAKAKQVHGF